MRSETAAARPLGGQRVAGNRPATTFVAGDAARSARAAWSYEAPRPAMKQVDHWIGFWEDVEIG